MPKIPAKIVIVGLILFISVFILFYRNKFNFSFSDFSNDSCTIEMVDESSNFDVSITNTTKFRNYILEFFPCEKDQFTGGNPYSNSPKTIKQITLIFDDLEHSSSMKFREGGIKTSWQYDFDEEGRVKIFMNYSLDSNNFTEPGFLFFIASRLSDIKNFNDPASRLERNSEEQQKFDYLEVSQAGLLVRFNN